MSRFRYRAKQGPEKNIEGVVDASSESSAIDAITRMGLMPISVSPDLGSDTAGIRNIFTLKKSFFSGKNLSVGAFSRYLANLSKAGLPLFRAIGILAELETHPSFKRVLESLQSEVSKGKSLSQAMSGHPDYFLPMYVAMIRAGESGGNLQEGLVRMAEYLRKQEDLASRIRRAVVYPALLVVTGIGSVFFILTFAVPKFSKVFSDLGKELPLSTRMVVSCGHFFEKTWFIIIPLCIFLFFALPRIFPRFFDREFRQRMSVHIPGFGRIIIRAGFTRFIRSLDLCLSNGMVFIDALKISIPVADHPNLTEALTRAFHVVEKGGSFGRALRAEPLLAGISAEMIGVGEESGNLQEVLRELADTCDRQIDEAVSHAVTLLEPMMILIVGAAVAFIVIALLLPVFELNTVF